MTRFLMLAALLGLGACSQSKDDRKKPEKFRRDFISVIEADKAVPANIRIDFQRLRSCRAERAERSGREIPPYGVDVVADLVDELRSNPAAADECESGKGSS